MICMLFKCNHVTLPLYTVLTLYPVLRTVITHPIAIIFTVYISFFFKKSIILLYIKVTLPDDGVK